jgi:hypothetical protein
MDEKLGNLGTCQFLFFGDRQIFISSIHERKFNAKILA